MNNTTIEVAAEKTIILEMRYTVSASMPRTLGTGPVSFETLTAPFNAINEVRSDRPLRRPNRTRPLPS